jgi:hypothetical protein
MLLRSFTIVSHDCHLSSSHVDVTVDALFVIIYACINLELVTAGGHGVKAVPSLPAEGGINACCHKVKLGDHVGMEDVMHAKADVTAREALLQTHADGAEEHIVGAHTRLHALAGERCAAVHPVAGPSGLQHALQPIQQQLDNIQNVQGHLVQQQSYLV